MSVQPPPPPWESPALSPTPNPTTAPISSGNMSPPTRSLSTYNGGSGVAPGPVPDSQFHRRDHHHRSDAGNIQHHRRCHQRHQRQKHRRHRFHQHHRQRHPADRHRRRHRKLTVTDLNGGTAAADLNIAGTATGTTIDGAEQKTITVTATDTLASLQTKINQLGFGVTANIVNDGSSGSPVSPVAHRRQFRRGRPRHRRRRHDQSRIPQSRQRAGCRRLLRRVRRHPAAA